MIILFSCSQLLLSVFFLYGDDGEDDESFSLLFPGCQPRISAQKKYTAQ